MCPCCGCFKVPALADSCTRATGKSQGQLLQLGWYTCTQTRGKGDKRDAKCATLQLEDPSMQCRTNRQCSVLVQRMCPARCNSCRSSLVRHICTHALCLPSVGRLSNPCLTPTQPQQQCSARALLSRKQTQLHNMRLGHRFGGRPEWRSHGQGRL